MIIKISLTIILFISQLFLLKGAEFKLLSKKKPIKISSIIEDKDLLKRELIKSNITLTLHAKDSSELFLRIEYVIEEDTLIDFLKVKNSYEGIVKQILRKPGQEIEIYVYLNHANRTKVQIEAGSVSITNEDAGLFETEYKQKDFVGAYWDRSDLPLFQYLKEDDSEYQLQIILAVNGNFIYDNLFSKIKIISPEQGIVEMEKVFNVNEEVFLKYTSKTITILLDEIKIKKQGFYYIQCTHQLKQKLVNGIDYLSYKLIPKENN